MARQRFIHPDIWSDPTIGKLGPIERLLFIGCFSNADDEGRLLGNAAFLRSTIFPYDDFTIKEVADMRDQMVSVCKNVVYYVVDDVEYLAFLKWGEYQNPRYPKPSKFPPPPCNQMDETLQPNGCKDAEGVTQACGKDDALGWVGMGMGRDGLGSNARARDATQGCTPDETSAEPNDEPPAAGFDGLDALEALIDDDDVSPIRFFEQATRSVCSAMVLSDLEEFGGKGLEASALKWAILEYKRADGRGHKYLRRILERLYNDRLFTARDAMAHEETRKQKQRPGSSVSPRASPHNGATGLDSALRSIRRRLAEATAEEASAT